MLVNYEDKQEDVIEEEEEEGSQFLESIDSENDDINYWQFEVKQYTIKFFLLFFKKNYKYIVNML